MSVAHPLAPDARLVTARDVAWLAASMIIVIAPHAQRAPWWLMLLTLGLYAWRGLLTLNAAPLPSRWLLLAIAAIAMLGVRAEYGLLLGRAQGIVMLVLFSGLKLLEMRTHRDATVGVFLCYFLLITNFLYSQSIPIAILMCVAIGVVTTTLVGFNAPGRGWRHDLRSAGLLLAHAVPAALLLFVLFPRVQGPLWGLPQDANAGVSGLSDTMTPGAMARLALSDAVAFRAEFAGEPPPQPLRYWRGPVLWDYDGRTWRMGETVLADFVVPKGGSDVYEYSVVLEPHDRKWLFALETVSRLPPRARFTDDGQVLARRDVRRRLRYEVSSISDPEPVARETRALLERARRLPEGTNPRATALARAWRAESADDAQLLARAISYLQNNRYTYTLEPPLMGKDSVDEFLFSAKAGFCEHFASAFVFLMRAAGVPARVVTGYQGGDLNPIDRIITVRQSDAHAWAEVYLPRRGWIRVDPTAAAIPGRVASGLARALPQDVGLPLMMRPQFQWLRALRYRWEVLAHKWNVWVLDYNPDRQRDLMAYFGMRDADWRKLTATLFTLLGGFTVLLLVWSLRKLGRQDPVQRAWLAFCRKLDEHGVRRAPHEGPRDFAERAAQRLPRAAEPIRAIAQRYIALRYGTQDDGRDVSALRHAVRRLRLA
ncbi:MAG: transglutaminase TgpA family protein [Burkholderiales bacterium]